ncbi:MAG TPA: DUF742 domain-containing protein [Pseudonocardiaceae bacterium]|jgi:hypothetical protein
MRSKRIRLYTLTGGRTKPRHHLLVETLISVPQHDSQFGATLMPESRALYDLARETISIAELSAHLTIPLGVIRVLISDLATQEMVFIHPTGFAYQYDRIILERILDGLKKLPA